MNKTIVIGLKSFKDEEEIDFLEYDIDAYLIENSIAFMLGHFGNRFEITLRDIDIIIYNRFIVFLKSKNVQFKEIEL